MSDEQETQYPFEVNKKCRDSFAAEDRSRRLLEEMVLAIAYVHRNRVDPWTVVAQEHPQLKKDFIKENRGCLNYDPYDQVVYLSKIRKRA
tara:strand:- start:3864 stop:4133 length:270 start_codon:yes stop_codon:yes gene_type:complete